MPYRTAALARASLCLAPLAVVLSGALAACTAADAPHAAPDAAPAATRGDQTASVEQAQRRIAVLERESGGRLGVTLRDPQGRVLLAHRGDERFAMCSAFKTLLAGMALSQAGGLAPDARLDFRAEDIPGYAPYARERAEAGWMSATAAAEHSVTLSDNMAANLLLDALGGPPALTRWIRTLGDSTTRLDRMEPELNENAVGDPRDTTTPLAFTESYRRLVTGDALAPPARATLIGWLVNSTTGLKRLRAGLPADWHSGDKTGTCGDPAPEVNDVAIIDPGAGNGEGGWYTLAFMLDRPRDTDDAQRIAAEVGRIAASLIAPVR